MPLPALIPAAGSLALKSITAATAAKAAASVGVGVAGAAAAKSLTGKVAARRAAKTSAKAAARRAAAASVKASGTVHSPDEAEFFNYATDDGIYRFRWGSRAEREAFEGYKKAAEEKHRSAQASASVVDSVKRSSKNTWTKFKGWFGNNSSKLIFPFSFISSLSFKTKRGGIAFGGYNPVSSKEHSPFVRTKVDVDTRSLQKKDYSKKKNDRNVRKDRKNNYSSGRYRSYHSSSNNRGSYRK